MKILALFTTLLWMLISTPPARAWKLETHYWLAKEVLKELDATEGTVTIPFKNGARVPSTLHQAVTTKRGDYLLGVLGPDTYPDMVAGQMTTHPGLEATPKDKKDILPPARTLLAAVGRDLKGPLWMTDDWMDWVRSRAFAPPAGTSQSAQMRNMAFAYGYLTHAAMDMWAHSYVNLYSGDVFSLLDEQEVEFRHMAIETLIKRTHQSILASPTSMPQEQAALELRNRLRNPASLAKGFPDELSQITAPIDFVRRTLVLNPSVANQYAREPSTLHLFAMYVYWAEVGEARARMQPLRNAVNAAAAGADKRVRDAEFAFNAADAALKTTAQAYSAAYEIFKQAENVATDAAAALDKAIRDTRRTFNLGENIDNWPPPAKAAIKFAQDAARSANNALTAARNEYNRLKDKRDRLQEDQENALKNVNTEKAARTAIRKVRDESLDVIDGGFNAWQEGLEDAVDAYLLAWEDTSKELMRPPGTRFSPGGDVTEPLKQWVTCWGPTFGLPVLTQIAPVCQKARNSYVTASETLKVLLQNTLIYKPVRDLIEALDREVALIAQKVIPEAGKMVSNTIRIDNGAIAGYSRSIVNLRSKEPTLQDIDADFANDISKKQLMTFPSRLTNLLYQDMGLPPPGNNPPPANKTLSDLKNFAALQNAFTMAKLVLLDGEELNRLTLPALPASLDRRNPSMPKNIPPPAIPYSIQARAGEILIGAVRSIDGDHQWQKFAPRLPRKTPFDCSRQWPDGSEADKYCRPRVFGYDAGDQGKGGLKFWQNRDLRETVFNKIFQGPLNPGLVSALGAQNLARGIGICAADPYPPTNGQDLCRDPKPVLNPPPAVKQMQPLVSPAQTPPQGQSLPPAGIQKPLPRLGP